MWSPVGEVWWRCAECPDLCSHSELPAHPSASGTLTASQGRGVPQLEEALLAEAELNAVMGDPSGPVEAVVIESHVDRGLG